MTFGRKLIKMREDYGISQKELEKKSGVSREYLSRFENEHLKNPTISMVSKIAGGFDMTLSAFLNGVLVD